MDNEWKEVLKTYSMSCDIWAIILFLKKLTTGNNTPFDLIVFDEAHYLRNAHGNSDFLLLRLNDATQLNNYL
jgi:hypothetical protein